MSRPFARGVTGSSAFGTLGFFFGAGSAGTAPPGVAGEDPSKDGVGVVGTDAGVTGIPRFCPRPTGGDLSPP